MNKQNSRSKFRASSKWKNFRKYMKQLWKIDYITQSPLRTGYNLHHLDMSDENYEVLDKNLFIPLNKKTHDVLHFIYSYYKKDKTILSRLEEILDKMVEINKWIFESWESLK